MPKRKTNDRSYSPRKLDLREVKQRFLIVCEGMKTEPYYFRSFRVPKAVVSVQGAAGDPTRLVNTANKLAQEDEFDQVWCVFDRDEGAWTAQNFNNALQNAKTHDFHIAYSNECFELWYILHFQFLNTGLPRSDYEDKLSELLGAKYRKNDPTIYQQLLGKQSIAIKHAEKLLVSYNRPNPERDNPSTTVHLLVQALNKFIN
jgi:RloB-like protein